MHKLLILNVLFISLIFSQQILANVASFKETVSCPVKTEDTNAMYGYFYTTSYTDTGKDEEGNTTAKVKDFSKKDGREAWACIRKAASLGNCSAIHIMWLYHSQSIQPDDYGYVPNIDIATKYERIHIDECRNNT